jgi:hypothetical protein
MQRRNLGTRRTKPFFSAGSASSALIVVARSASDLTDTALERKAAKAANNTVFLCVLCVRS